MLGGTPLRGGFIGVSSVDWILLCIFTTMKHLAFSSTFAGSTLSKKFFSKIADIFKWLPYSRLDRENIAIIDHFRHKAGFTKEKQES